MVLSMTGFAALVHAQRPKLLALHGGDETIASFQAEQGMAALMNSLSPQYDFVFVQAPNAGNVWFPGDDSYPTQSISVLQNAVSSQGPFHGILGYSQGAGIALAFLGVAPPGTFQMAVFYCAVPVEDAQLRAGMSTNSPFGGIPSLFFAGAQDRTIPPALATFATSFFTNPAVVTSQTAAHHLPFSSDPTFSTVLSFFTSYLPGSNSTFPGGPGFNSPSSPPDTTSSGSDPCFPSAALVTTSDGTAVRIDALQEGDTILATTADGFLTTDTVYTHGYHTPWEPTMTPRLPHPMGPHHGPRLTLRPDPHDEPVPSAH